MAKKIRLHQTSRSILEELSVAVPQKRKEHVIESRGHHIIASAINFLNVINENFDDEDAEMITRRFLSAIKNNDPNKFVRQVRKIREGKEYNDED